MKLVYRIQKNLKSLGLSFDSKSKKVPKKVVIFPKEYKLNKIMQFKKYIRDYRKFKESRYTISFFHVSWSSEGWFFTHRDTELHNLYGFTLTSFVPWSL